MSKPLQYVQQSLAASGIAIWSSSIAQVLRPDIWTSGMECGGDFASQHTRNLIDGYGVDTCHVAYATLQGIGGTVKVLARSLDQLATRIEWLTGYKVLELVADATKRQPAGASAPRPDAQTNGDLFAGIVTKEDGRLCSSCEFFTAGHSCNRAKESGIDVPASGVLRRCLAYRPLYESVDGRSGAQLWPELSKSAV